MILVVCPCAHSLFRVKTDWNRHVSAATVIAGENSVLGAKLIATVLISAEHTKTRVSVNDLSCMISDFGVRLVAKWYWG